jgi:cytochrome c oxidase subunit 2
VIIYLSSKDVIHSFNLPLFRVKQDAIPGERIPLWFLPVKTTSEIQKEMSWEMSTREVVTSTNIVVMAEYKNQADSVIAQKGDLLTEELMTALREAGIQKITVSQDLPTEIACAQLCGLGHYRMRGSVKSMTQEEYAAWLAEEATYLQP